MSKQVRLLDIDSCSMCKHLDIAQSEERHYAVCRKENRIVKVLVGYRRTSLLPEIAIPTWCSLRMIEEESKANNERKNNPTP